MANSYYNFITDIYNTLSGDYSTHFIGIDEVLEEVPPSSDFIIRPSLTFGTCTPYTNLRDVEENLIVNLQLFREHNSNKDLIEVGEDIRTKVKDLHEFSYDKCKYSINQINLLKNFDTKYCGVTVQITSRKIDNNQTN